MPNLENVTIAIVGGTGDLGSGLARAWTGTGRSVVIGSRSRDKAIAAARQFGDRARGDDNFGAVNAADVVVLAVPFANHEEILLRIRDAVQGKIVVDAVVPLEPRSVSTVRLPPEGSAAQIAQTILGPSVKVVAAFHNVAAKKLQAGLRADCDVLVCGNDKNAREIVIGLARDVATRGIDAGALANSAAAEALTSVLIGINRRYRVAGAGIRITGLEPSEVG